ncbi:unnamed protein product [Dovyalis caffra]|uniref:Uncharacterized protein n=1 Tax=Dovyalis caffra TaxID=77055 RepID=A0AAV1QVW3_9ROSI|nr:unnamed protein product [Dovyalis caffra]
MFSLKLGSVAPKLIGCSDNHNLKDESKEPILKGAHYAKESAVSEKGRITSDLTKSYKTSNLEAETTKNIDQIDEFNKKDSKEKSNQDAVKRRTTRSKARSVQDERDNLEANSTKIDSAQESSEFYCGIKSLAFSTQYGSEEGKDSRNKGLAELESGEGGELTLTGYSGDIEAETEEESKEDDSEEKGFLSADNIEESDPEFKELLQTSESDAKNTEQGQEKGSEEGFVMKKKKALLEWKEDISSNDLELQGSDGSRDILTNMKGLEEEMRKFDVECGSEDESYQLKNEEDDVKLMNKAEKNQNPPKTSFMEWLRGHVQLYEDWDTVKEIKAKVVKLAAELSHLLVNLMFSLPKIDLVDTMFQRFLNSLKYQCKDEDSKVIHRIMLLLEFIDEEAKKFEKLKEVDTLEESSDTDEDDEFHRKEPDQELFVKDLLSLLKDDLKECEKELESIASRVDELKAEYGCILGPKDQKYIYEVIKLKINELWNP